MTNKKGETFKDKMRKVPRCPAMWPAGLLGTGRPYELRERRCNRYATETIQRGVSTSHYCPEHAADSRRYQAQTDAKEAAEAARADARWHKADEFVSRLPDTPETWTDTIDTPKGVKVVHALRCACGQTYSRTEFPDHYARCDA